MEPVLGMLGVAVVSVTVGVLASPAIGVAIVAAGVSYGVRRSQRRSLEDH